MKVVVIQTAFIGDVILCSPLLEALNRHGCRVGMVVRPEAACIFEQDTRVARLHRFDKRGNEKGFTGLIALSRQLRKEGYDTAVVPHRSLRSAVLARCAGIPVRIGFSTSAGARLFTHRVLYDRRAHEVVRNQSLLVPLGISGEPPLPKIFVTGEDEGVARDFLVRNGIRETDSVIGFGPGSQWFTKQWGGDRFGRLAQLITRDNMAKIVCFGSETERDLCDEICARNPEWIVNAAGSLNLREASAALARVTAVVTNDNGFMHLAAASSVPVIALFGPTVPEFGFAPPGENHTIIGRDLYCRPCSIHGLRACPVKHFRCMTEIKPEDVFDAVRRYMAAID